MSMYPKFLLVSLIVVAAGWLSVSSSGCAQGGDDEIPAADGATGPRGDGGTGQCANCAANQDCCGGFCIDTMANRNNCGGCNNACDPAVANECRASTCVCNFGPACAAGSACCATGCKDLMTDNNNCGACGEPCGANETCQEGMCVCAAAGGLCSGGQACCASGCVDTQVDTANCGGCEIACGEAETCGGGACACPFTCPAEFPFGQNIVCCDAGCFDLCSDNANCGGCGTACAAEETCGLGDCTGAAPDFVNCLF